MAAEDVLAEALARIEYKLDQIMYALNMAPSAPMNMPGATCPACTAFIEYNIDPVKNVVIRKCNCGTGKFVASISLTPNTQVRPNGAAPSDFLSTGSDYDEPPSKDRRKR